MQKSLYKHRVKDHLLEINTWASIQINTVHTIYTVYVQENSKFSTQHTHKITTVC